MKTIRPVARLFLLLSIVLLGGVPLGAYGAAGDLDAAYNPNVTGGPVYASATLPDGRMMVSGAFTAVGGGSHVRIARLNADGSADSSYTASVNNSVFCMAVQADGKVLIGGAFTSVNGSAISATNGVNCIARLNADGTLDSSFNTSGGVGLGGANNFVYAIAVQSDGKLVIGGNFTSVNGSAVSSTTGVNRIARLHADGTLDTAFNRIAGTGLGGANSVVVTIALQADGRILIGGQFTSVNGSVVSSTTGVNRIARLNSDGTLDTSFNMNSGVGLGGANDLVFTIVIQADGKIVIGGDFTSVNGSAVSPTTGVNRIARLHADGSLDTSFNRIGGTGLGGLNDIVYAVALQTDGKLVIGGGFTSVNGSVISNTTGVNRITRLNENGTRDTAFNTNGGVGLGGANNTVHSVTIQGDGKIWLGGTFSSVNGTARSLAARLENDPATQSLSQSDPAQVLWSRGGSSPEVSLVSFELSTDGGTSYTPLPGVPTRVDMTPNWQLTGLSLPANGLIRARGRNASPFGSSGIVEFVAPIDLVGKIQNFVVKFTPKGKALTDGAATRFFGPVRLNNKKGALRKITITNTGNKPLRKLRIVRGGPNGRDYMLSFKRKPLKRGKSTTVMIRFRPRANGDRESNLRIFSSETPLNPFDLKLFGKGRGKATP